MQCSAGQVIGQFSIQWISDWFGRKIAMYGFLFLLLIVSISHVMRLYRDLIPLCDFM